MILSMASWVLRLRSVSSIRSSALATVVAGIKPVEQRRTRTSDVEEARGRGCEPRDDLFAGFACHSLFNPFNSAYMATQGTPLVPFGDADDTRL